MSNKNSVLSFLIVGILLCLGTLFVGCKKDIPKETTPVDTTSANQKPIDNRIVTEPSLCTLDYFYFKPGTYWVYETIEGDYDSVWVVDNPELPKTHGKHDWSNECEPRYCENKSVNVALSHLHIPTIPTDPDLSGLYKYGYNDLFVLYDNKVCFDYLGHISTSQFCVSPNSNRIDSLLIGGTYYKNILVAQLYYDSGPGLVGKDLFLSSATKYYINQSHGIVRREAAMDFLSTDNTDFRYKEYNLVRSYIVR